jgi:cytochrome P450
MSTSEGRCPFSGKDFNPFAPPVTGSLHAALAQARQEKPLFFSEVLQAWIATRYDDIYAILQDPKRFSSNVDAQARAVLHPEARAMLEAGCRKLPLIFEDPPEHTHSRTVLTRLFAREALAAMEPRIRELAEELVADFPAQGEVDLVERFTHPLPIRVIFMWLGLPLEKLGDIRHWSNELIRLLSMYPMTLEEQKTCVRGVLTMQDYVAGLIRERVERPREDGMTLLAQRLREEAGLSAEDLAMVVVMLITAGHETTTCLLGLAVRVLLEQPERWRQVHEAPHLIPQMVEEVLRYEGPTVGTSRLATETVELGGQTIPAGARVLVMLPSGSRDEQRFPEPARFDPQRPNLGNHLAFGKGIHVCLGAGLARLEARVALEVLTRRLPKARLVEPPQVLPGMVRHFASLRVAWDAA